MKKDGICDICENSDCPCDLCHGDPKSWLGGINSGIVNAETGEITCPSCFRTSG